MKSVDLMIGDWVSLFQGKEDGGSCNVQVTSIFPGYEIGIDGKGCDYDSAIPNLLFPITLTPGILEKNDATVKALNQHDFGILFEDYGNAYLVKRVCDPEHGYHDVEHICDLKYVHTLQHALKLCGIENEVII
jgi:hypothetical protein